MRMKVQEAYLKADREGKDKRELEATLNTLKWVMGEDVT